MTHLPPIFREVIRADGPSVAMELDKIPGFWTVTAWPDDDIGVVLRVRVAHSSNGVECDLICESRFKGDPEFHILTKISGTNVWKLLGELEGLPMDLNAFPGVWREHFIDMARRWAACCWILEFASGSEIRYRSEPASSRDYLEFPDAPPEEVDGK